MSVHLTKIGVFFDGNYFAAASSYYLHHHSRAARISIEGIRNFVVHRIAQEEAVNPRHCPIVESHLFAGRLTAIDARGRDSDSLFRDRNWDDILQREAVTAHYLPLGMRGEKGVDVLFALECYEAVLLKGLDVVVLVTGDGDFVPLVRKLNARGVRVMVIGWEYSYLDNEQRERSARSSRSLMAEATYPIRMDELITGYADLPDTEKKVIDDVFLKRKSDFDENGGCAKPQQTEPSTYPVPDAGPPPAVAAEITHPAPAKESSQPPQALEPETVAKPVQRAPQGDVDQGVVRPAFKRSQTGRTGLYRRPASNEAIQRFAEIGFAGFPQESEQEDSISDSRVPGEVTRILQGYGFIKPEWGQANVYFHRSDVVEGDFYKMAAGTRITYVEEDGDRGTPVAKRIRVLGG